MRASFTRVLLVGLAGASLLCLVALGHVGSAEAATGTWTANAEADLAGYHAYLAPGTCANPGPYSKVAIFPKTATSGTFPTPTDGVYCGKLAAFDTAGNVSLFSNTAEVTINLNPPGAPAGFGLTAN